MPSSTSSGSWSESNPAAPGPEASLCANWVRVFRPKASPCADGGTPRPDGRTLMTHARPAPTSGAAGKRVNQRHNRRTDPHGEQASCRPRLSGAGRFLLLSGCRGGDSDGGGAGLSHRRLRAEAGNGADERQRRINGRIGPKALSITIGCLPCHILGISGRTARMPALRSRPSCAG